MKLQAIWRRIAAYALHLSPMILVVVIIWRFGKIQDWRLNALLAVLFLASLVWTIQRSESARNKSIRDERQTKSVMHALKHLPIALGVFREDFSPVWQNLASQGLLLTDDMKKQISAAPAGHSTMMFSFGGKIFEAMLEKFQQQNGLLLLLQESPLRKEEAALVAALPAVGYVYIDNFDELDDGRDRTVLPVVRDAIERAVEEVGGVARRFEQGKYLLLLDNAALGRLKQRKFDLLDAVREIKTLSSVAITLSIGVGWDETLIASNEAAKQAMELALGRGGDQAVVKEQGNHLFYGGKLQPGERYSKVKSRVFAGALGNLMAQYDVVLAMGHKMADLDALASAVGVIVCARAMDKRARIVLEQSNAMIESFLLDAANDAEYHGMFVRPDEAAALCGKKTLVVVVDTQRVSATAAPELIETAGSVVVIDHHRRGADGNIAATLQYAQPHASSACELVCEVIQYFKPDVNLSALTSSALLSGITLDTKNFTVNTGSRTFEAAAYLRKHGADASFVKQIFQEDKQAYLDRADIVRTAEMIYPDIALAACPEGKVNAALISAQAADALTAIKGIRAAFVLSYNSIENTVSVSARSVGPLNVQAILEKLGGGGHFNAAGAQMPQTRLEEAKNRVMVAVREYLMADQL